MAKKVIIGDLVVRVGVDSKETERKLKNFDKKLKNTTKGQTKELDKQSRSEKKAIENANVWMKRSREFYKLRKADGKAAKKIENDLTKAYIYGDRVKQAALKRQVSDRMESYRQEMSYETTKERNHKKAMKARMLMRKRAYKDKARQHKMDEKARSKERRYENERRITARRRLRGGASRFVGNTTGMVGGALGGAGMIAGAGYAGASAIQSTATLRQSETSLKIALESRNKADEFQAQRDKMYTQAAALHIDPALYIREIAMNMQTLPSVSIPTIIKLISGMSGLGSALGASPEAQAGSLQGMRQFFSGATDWENVKQMFENMGPMLEILAKPLGMTSKEFMAAGAAGNLKGIISKFGGLEKFLEKVANLLSKKGTEAFKAQKGTLPYAIAETKTQALNAQRDFGKGAESGAMNFLNNISTILSEHQEDFEIAGGYFSDFLKAVGVVVEEDLLPMLSKANVALGDMSSKERVDMFVNIIERVGEAIAGLFAVFAAAKAIGAIVAVGELVSGIMALVASPLLAGAAIAVTSLTGAIVGLLALLPDSGKGGSTSSGGIFGDNAITRTLDTPISTLFSNLIETMRLSMGAPTPTQPSAYLLGQLGSTNTNNNHSNVVHVHGDITEGYAKHATDNSFSIENNPFIYKN